MSSDDNQQRQQPVGEPPPGRKAYAKWLQEKLGYTAGQAAEIAATRAGESDIIMNGKPQRWERRGGGGMLSRR